MRHARCAETRCSTWLCLALGAFFIAAVLFGARPARAAGIPPGQEALAADMLGRGATLAGGCRWDGASVRPGDIESRYVCPDSPHPLALTLVAPDASAPPDTTQTERFRLIPANPSTFPPALLLDVAGRVRARESAWIWEIDKKPLPPDHPVARQAPPVPPLWPRGIPAVLVVTGGAGLISLVLLLVSRRRDDGRAAKQPRATAPWSVLALLSLGALALPTGLSLARFQFVYDDYRFLVRALENPWMWDESLRLLSTSGLFRFAAVVDPEGITPFLVANALMLGLAVACWALALRRHGFERDEAVLAAAWFGLSPGTPDMLRRASGIENLAGSACVLMVLYLLTRVTAAGRASPSRRVGLVGLLFVTSIAGVFVKFPFMAVVPPMAWLWLRGVSPQTSSRSGAAALAVGLAAAILIPCAIALHGAGSLGIAESLGFLRIAHNAGIAVGTLFRWVQGIAAAFGLLALYRLVNAARSKGPDGRRGLHAVSTEAAQVVREARAALCDRVGALPVWALMVALAALFTAPTLLNVRYFSTHYVFLATAPLAALAAKLLFRIGDPRRTPRVVQALAMLVAMPWGVLRPDSPDIPAERAPAWLNEVGRLAAGQAKPDRVVFIPACSSAEESVRTAEELYLVYLAAGQQFGVQWVTSWRDIDVQWAAPMAAGDRALALRRPNDLAICVCRDRSMSLSPPEAERDKAPENDPLPR